MTVSRTHVAAQAQRIHEVLERVHPGATSSLAEDAWSTLEIWTDVQIRMVPDTQTNDRCSVAGGYVYDTAPPTLTVTASASRGRQAFTVLHELGHHLQQTDVDLAVAARQGPGVQGELEEAACDAFAARILITEEQLAAVLTDRSPAAETLIELLQITQASRSACAARVAERLGTTGIVAVIDSTGTVLFAKASGDLAPPARGSDQSESAVVAAALARGTRATNDRTYFTYRNGSRSLELYGDAAWAGDYLMVIAVLDRPGWKPFAPPHDGQRDYSPRLDGWCDICQESFPVTDRCSACGQGRCPRGHCRCITKMLRTCDTCWLEKHVTQFPAPASTTCKDCR